MPILSHHPIHCQSRQISDQGERGKERERGGGRERGRGGEGERGRGRGREGEGEGEGIADIELQNMLNKHFLCPT